MTLLVVGLTKRKATEIYGSFRVFLKKMHLHDICTQGVGGLPWYVCLFVTVTYEVLLVVIRLAQLPVVITVKRNRIVVSTCSSSFQCSWEQHQGFFR